MVKAAAVKPRPPKAKKVSPLKTKKKTVTLKAKTTTTTAVSPNTTTGAKFLALKKTEDVEFRKKAVQKRQFLKKGEAEDKRGCIVLSNIPHGFFEGEMRRYFRQFGVLENVRLVRSKKTGQSCGFAYVEFEHYEVAKIVAKHMDGYLTFGRIMKCKVVPHEVVTDKLFKGKNIRPNNCPKLNIRKGAIRKLNKKRTEKQIQRRTQRLKSTYSKKFKKLQELGIDLPAQTLLATQEKQSEAADKVEAVNGQETPDATLPLDIEEGDKDLLPEDASDVELSKDINDDLTQEQKEELSTQREELAAKIISQLNSEEKTKTPKKLGAKKTPKKSDEKMVLDVDESDDEVMFKTPPNVVKRYIKMGSKSATPATPKVKTPKSAKGTPKTPKVTPKKAKLTPKLPKLTLEEENDGLEAIETPKKLKTPGSKKATPKINKKTPKALKMTPKEGENSPVELTPTPKIAKTTPGGKNATPKVKNKTPKAGKATPGPDTPDASPKVVKKTPKRKKLTPKALINGDTPKIEELSPVGIQNTPKIMKKTPKNKKSTPGMKDILIENIQDTPTTTTPKKKTPKAKKMGFVTENIIPSGEEPTPAPTPVTLTPTPTPGKRKQSEDVTILTEATPSKKEKKEKLKKNTPAKTMTSPKTPKKTVTPKVMSSKKTPQKTPKKTPSKRKTTLESTPVGKSVTKKQKTPKAL